MASLCWEGRRLQDAAFRFVRHDAHNRTVLCPPAAEGPALDEIARASAAFGTRLVARGEEVAIALPD
jgi:hypothetical protein